MFILLYSLDLTDSIRILKKCKSQVEKTSENISFSIHSSKRYVITKNMIVLGTIAS